MNREVSGFIAWGFDVESVVPVFCVCPCDERSPHVRLGVAIGINISRLEVAHEPGEARVCCLGVCHRIDSC